MKTARRQPSGINDFLPKELRQESPALILVRLVLGKTKVNRPWFCVGVNEGVRKVNNVMTTTQQTVIGEILSHVHQQGGSYKSWYAGIASDPKDRLFNDHNVSQDSGWWIYRITPSSSDARAIEDYLLGLGFSGGNGGGDYSTKYVYAYLIGPETQE